ncbi:ABC transporter ATP-binding protein [Phormidium sp. CCY1219]|uniref:ABC transporter ATP-binding protein n=1 Tax=Phormidium sp. CCY1219 TaxID=2886104 RepID=UPI002D1E4EB6|nr:ABC transporter ATP-binding protein [Phormidium sp. CCY1219]MEB3829413.1 ABC transporter ATP-binding protein [Phormidium sp. CCY1219]
MTEPLIELQGICKSFGGKTILDGVDLSIYHNEAVSIIGPSGTGKSTILRIIAGLLTPDAGEVYVEGQRRERWMDDLADPLGIGMVFQNAALFDSLNVEENIGFFLYQHSKLPRKRIRQLVNEKLEMVGLPGIGNKFPAELSGGMRKRVSFARAIMANPEDPKATPEVLLYDEPTAGLDPIASTVIEDLIRDLQAAKGGCSTYVMVTHQDSTIRRTSDRIIFLYDGKVQWEGKVEQIDRTEHPMVRQFFSGAVTGPIQVVG